MFVILLNPVSGQHDIVETKKIISRTMRLHNREFKIILMQQDGSHKVKIRKYHDELNTVFVAAGGDGTVSDLVNILADSKPVIGIIPVGSSNSLARELNIPLQTQDAVVTLVTSTKSKKLGVLVSFNRIFILDISVGINALVMRDTPRREKRIWGMMAYIRHAVRLILTFRSRKFTITVDGASKHRRATDVIIANGGIIKSFLKRVAGHAELTSQHFEVIIIKTRTLRDYMRFVISFFLGKYNKDKGIEIIRPRKTISIQCEKQLPVQGDGDIIGKTPVSITIHHRAFSVIVPENS